MNTYKNYWNYNIHTPIEILSDKYLNNLIKKVFKELLSAFNLDDKIIEYFITKLFSLNVEQDMELFERNVKDIFTNYIDEQMKENSFNERAKLICKQIQEHILGDKIADYGCGDGLVSYYLKEKWNKNFDYKLFDIMDYRNNRVTFDFEIIKQRQVLEYNNVFNTVLLLTVIHHSIDPQLVIENAIKISKKRIVIIESVFDVPNDSVYSPIKGLDIETQIKYAIFWDWFYNRVVHNGVNVPYNFQPPSKWEELFDQYRLKLVHKENLGVDQKIVPEHHFLFVLDKN